MKATLRLKFILGCLILLVVVSCSRYDHANFGLYPKYIRGQIRPVPEASDTPLIIVIEKQRTFMEFRERGAVYRQTIFVLREYPNGRYLYNWGLKAESVTIHFYLSGRLANQYVFNSGLGIGGFVYNPELQKTDNWKNSYLFDVKPYLSGFVTQPEFQLSDIDRGIIAQWMEKTENRMNILK